jgi:hypothetical protein
VGELLFLDMLQSKCFVFGVDICGHRQRLVVLFFKVQRTVVSSLRPGTLYVRIYAHGDSSEG